MCFAPHPSGVSSSIDVAGDLVGIFENMVYEARELSVAAGDRFLLYSDGLVEIDGASPEQRESCCRQLVAACNGIAPDANLDSVVADIVFSMTEDKTIRDDIVVLGVEV